MPVPTTPLRKVLLRLSYIMLPAGALLGLTFLVPELDPQAQTHPDLSGDLGLAAYWIAETGGTVWLPLVGISMTFLVVSRPGASGWQRVGEALTIVLVLAVFLGGGAYLNEHVIKPAFAVPRPNIRQLARTPAEAPALRMTIQEFYAIPNKAARSEHLKNVLDGDASLHERVRAHWIAETGYSFPSGHSFASMLFTSFFVATGLWLLSGFRLGLVFVLPAWAVAVCFSRPLLRVHSPTDICVGGFEGMLLGTLAFLLARWVMTHKFYPEMAERHHVGFPVEL